MRIIGLPFQFRIEGDVSRPSPASLTVNLDPGGTEDDFEQLLCVLPWFAELGKWRALGGAKVAPSAVQAKLREGEPNHGAPNPTWYFEALSIDPKACVILANLIYATHLPVRAVLLHTEGPTDDTEIPCDAYPERWTALPFEVEEDRTVRDVNVILDFSMDLSPAQGDEVGDALRHFCVIGSIGGFRESVPLSERLDLVPHGEPELVLDQMTLSFRDYALNEGAYDALVNLSAGMHSHGIPIVRITIE
jgi:hypothetical protein